MTFNAADELAREGYKDLARQMDELLEKLIEEQTGDPEMDLEKLRQRGLFQRTPDGVETFIFDSKPLAQFSPIDIEIEQSSDSTMAHLHRKVHTF